MYVCMYVCTQNSGPYPLLIKTSMKVFVPILLMFENTKNKEY